MSEYIGGIGIFAGIIGLLILLWGASTIQDTIKEQDEQVADWARKNIKYDPSPKDNPHKRRY